MYVRYAPFTFVVLIIFPFAVLVNCSVIYTSRIYGNIIHNGKLYPINLGL